MEIANRSATRNVRRSADEEGRLDMGGGSLKTTCLEFLDEEHSQDAARVVFVLGSPMFRPSL